MSLVNHTYIDLTQTLTDSIPSWNGSCGFRHDIKMDYPQGCRVQALKIHAGVGAHMDAPTHFYETGKDISEIPLERLIVPLIVIDISDKAHADYHMQPEDLFNFEEEWGRIPAGTFAAIHTGWSRFWENAEEYRNPDSKGAMHFPGISADVATLLVKRGIYGLGIDTLSPDGSDMTFPVHKIVLKKNLYILENLKALDRMPPTGSEIIILPIKFKEGTEAPVRAVGAVRSF